MDICYSWCNLFQNVQQLKNVHQEWRKKTERQSSDKICSSCWGRRLQRDWNSRRSYLAFHFTTFSTETLQDKQVSKHTDWDRETKTSKFSRYVYMDERSSVMKMFHGCSPVPGFCKSFQSITGQMRMVKRGKHLYLSWHWFGLICASYACLDCDVLRGERSDAN